MGSPIERARRLRADSTPPEKKLWNLLRDRRLGGFKFRRQQPVGRFVLDFYCHEVRVGVELDGQRHNRQADEQRDQEIARDGVIVLRFSASEFEKNTDAVLAKVLRVCQRRSPEGPLP